MKKLNKGRTKWNEKCKMLGKQEKNNITIEKKKEIMDNNGKQGSPKRSEDEKMSKGNNKRKFLEE